MEKNENIPKKIILKSGLTYDDSTLEYLAEKYPEMIYHEPPYWKKDTPPKGSIFKKLKWFLCTEPDTDIHIKVLKIITIGTVINLTILLVLELLMLKK